MTTNYEKIKNMSIEEIRKIKDTDYNSQIYGSYNKTEEWFTFKMSLNKTKNYEVVCIAIPLQQDA